MVINKLLTTKNYENTNNTGRIKYIVIHYVGATGGAKANCKYFKSTYRGSSAHYFVGHSGEIWQCVEDADVAWHCGAKSYKHSTCRNSNSIGIEMCVKKNKNGWYFEQATIDATIELVKELMKKYNIPAANVIRHYDVTEKICPEPYVRDTAAWNDFKARLAAKPATTTTKATSVATSSGTFRVKVTVDALNIRKGAGTVYKKTGCIRDKGVYTIVETKGKWGKLKSGAGWIHLGYTKRV